MYFTTISLILEDDLNVIKPSHRDLLGGSNTDLSNLGDQPLKPAEKVDENYIEYCDPFDTTVVYSVAPGQTELKYLERELLSDIKKETDGSLSDEDFDPRALENKTRGRTQSRPDVLIISGTKTVSFDLPSPQTDLLSACLEESSKILKPLTPYYDRRDSIPQASAEESDADPFDTSFVAEVAPGKAELKLIESDLFDPEKELLHSISDRNFDPRDEKQVAIAEVVQTIKDIYNPKPIDSALTFKESEPIDLFVVENEVESKVLTPAKEDSQDQVILFSADPFDTSIANNILPGRTELKLLETELINSDNTYQNSSCSKDISSKSTEAKQDLLIHSADTIIDKPLSPVTNFSGTYAIEEEIDDNFDPFDTSIANNIAPGRTELKLLESELI